MPNGSGNLERLSPAQRAARWWNTLRYYRPSQLAMRMVAIARLRHLRWSGKHGALQAEDQVPGLRVNRGFSQLLHYSLQQRLTADSAAEARKIFEGRFCFLNQERALPDPVDWGVDGEPARSRLWRFHLHYHEYLLDLAAQAVRAGENEGSLLRERAWSLVRQWIARNPVDEAPWLQDAWHPYCISRRLPVWMLLWCAAPRDDELGSLALGSMFSQARFLERRLERDVRGNHLLENAKALTLAGAFFSGSEADRWLRKGTELLRRQLCEQILPYGLHFEQSPMYHAHVLGAVMDVRDALEPILPEFSEFLAATAARMAGFLRDILHQDGEIPLLGDSCFRQSPRPQSLLARAQDLGGPGPEPESEPIAHTAPEPPARLLGEYWVFRDGRDFLILDAAPVGPDHLPAHAHADLLSFEASVNGRRLFVDSGVFNYEDDEMRRYCRSTAAHNTLEIDQKNQCDVWSRFRMGYRGWPFPLSTGESDGFHWARAGHNAYRRLGVPRVGRWVACRPGGPWLCVDWAQGKGRHQLSSWLHLHPDVVAKKTADDEIQLELHGLVLRLGFLTPGDVSLLDAWYCPEFGLRIPSLAVRWTSAAVLPAVCGWSLTWGCHNGKASLKSDPACLAELLWHEAGGQWQLSPIG